MKKLNALAMAVVLGLTLGTYSSAATYKITHSYPQGGPYVGKETLLQFSLFRGTDTTPLTSADLQVEHEKLIHLMTVDSGFIEYQHQHPVETSPGIWQLPITIKVAGDYRFFVQMLPQDEILTKTVAFDDKYLENPQQIVPISPVHPEQKLTFEEGEFKITIKQVSGELKQKVTAEIVFQVEKNGIVIPIEDLDNYLGAKMHIAAISSDKKDFVHAHPESDGIVKLYFKQPGYYGIFMQYSYKGLLHTNQFAVQVK